MLISCIAQTSTYRFCVTRTHTVMYFSTSFLLSVLCAVGLVSAAPLPPRSRPVDSTFKEHALQISSSNGAVSGPGGGDTLTPYLESLRHTEIGYASLAHTSVINLTVHSA